MHKGHIGQSEDPAHVLRRLVFDEDYVGQALGGGDLSETAVLDASPDKNETDARLLVLEKSRRVQQDVEPLHDAHGAREHGDETILQAQPAGQGFVPQGRLHVILIAPIVDDRNARLVDASAHELVLHALR